MLIRIVGPTLAGASYNVSGAMADPKLVLTRNENGVLTNDWQQDNWGDEANATLTPQIAQQVSAFPSPTAATTRPLSLPSRPAFGRRLRRGRHKYRRRIGGSVRTLSYRLPSAAAGLHPRA